MKKYWNKINLGWKRIHYFLSIIFSGLLTIIYANIFGVFKETELIIIWIILIAIYFLIIVTIEWIKDGFKQSPNRKILLETLEQTRLIRRISNHTLFFVWLTIVHLISLLILLLLNA